MRPLLHLQPRKKSPRIYDGGTTEPVRPPPATLSNPTIGITTEIILIFPHADVRNNDPEGTAQSIVRAALSSETFDEPCSVCKNTHAHKLPLSWEEQDAEAPGYAEWKVRTAEGVSLQEADFDRLHAFYAVVGVGISSRVFGMYGRTKCPADIVTRDFGRGFVYGDFHGGLAAHPWKRELGFVDRVLEKLGQRAEYRVVVNETTGFRVHVGNGSEGPRGLSLDVAVGLLGLFTVFERQFDTISTTKRIGGGVRGKRYPPVPGRPRLYRYVSEDMSSVQEDAGAGSRPLSAMHLSALDQRQHLMQVPGLKGWATEQHIPAFLANLFFACPDRLSLQAYDNEKISFRQTVLDITHVWDNDLIDHNIEFVRFCMQKPTIEFRSHTGTLDFDEQCHWIVLVANLVLSLYSTPKKDVYAYLMNAWDLPHTTYTLPMILKHLQVPQETIDYYMTVTAQINDPLGKTLQPHLPRVLAEYDAEKQRTDYLHHTGVPTTLIGRNREHRSASNVRQKIKHKFSLGLYGKFGEETVVEFCKSIGEEGERVKGEFAHLVIEDIEWAHDDEQKK